MYLIKVWYDNGYEKHETKTKAEALDWIHDKEPAPDGGEMTIHLFGHDGKMIPDLLERMVARFCDKE